MVVDGAGANEAVNMGAALYSAFALHRASKDGARALGFPALGRFAPGMAADVSLFDLAARRNFGLHDPALAPMITGAAQVRHSFVNGRPVVHDGAKLSLTLQDLAQDAARVMAQLARAADTA
jgi:cytosine/adenosine deaminase-related metal-dependent hydrolase